MYKLNTQLPQSIPDMPKEMPSLINWHQLLGALFLLVVGMALIALIYNWETGKSLDNSATQVPGHACIQVITPARNPVTKEVKDFPTPCDVPSTWELITN